MTMKQEYESKVRKLNEFIESKISEEVSKFEEWAGYTVKSVIITTSDSVRDHKMVPKKYFRITTSISDE